MDLLEGGQGHSRAVGQPEEFLFEPIIGEGRGGLPDVRQFFCGHPQSLHERRRRRWHEPTDLGAEQLPDMPAHLIRLAPHDDQRHPRHSVRQLRTVPATCDRSGSWR